MDNETVDDLKKRFQKPKKPDDDLGALAAEMAKLSPLEYELAREEKAKTLGVRVSILDKEVDNLRPKQDKDAKGSAISLREFEPCDERVNGAEVLDEIRSHLDRHMVMSEAQADAVTLWIPHAHLFDRFAHTPRLMITAPDAECGKTELMAHLIGNMVQRPQYTENMTPAVFFRMAEEYKPTFLMDEADVFLDQDNDLPGGLNGGFEPHGGVLRCVGDDNEVRFFSTHTPVALAGIRIHEKLKPPTISRSIIIELERATEEELPEENVYDHRKHLAGLYRTGRKVARWCADNGDAIAQAEPSLPPKVRNRRADKWRPLFAIAEAAGGHWPDRAKRALFGQPDISTPSKAMQLLIDIHEYMQGQARNIKTTALIHALCNMEDSPWADYNFRQREPEERAIQPRQLATLLKQYKIERCTVRVPNDPKTAKGYRAEALKKAWDRYVLPGTPPEKGSQGNNVDSARAAGESYGSHQKNGVTHSTGRKAPSHKGCDPVTHFEGGYPEREGIEPETNPPEVDW